MTELTDRGLPKWPQMLVTGKPVPVSVAKEIIRRTDTFFTLGYGGNDHGFVSEWQKRLGLPRSEDVRGDWASFSLKEEAFQKRWQSVCTEYVFNSWVSCAWVGGAHGWCHPDGTIGFTNNVGKWPSIEAVLRDWEVLAEAFPMLELGVTLMDNEESCGGSPVVSILVNAGKAELVDPEKVDVHAGHQRLADFDFASGFARREETGIPLSWLRDWEQQFKTA